MQEIYDLKVILPPTLMDDSKLFLNVRWPFLVEGTFAVLNTQIFQICLALLADVEIHFCTMTIHSVKLMFI